MLTFSAVFRLFLLAISDPKTEANTESKIIVKPQLSSLLLSGHPVLSDQKVNRPTWPAILLIEFAGKYLASNSMIRSNY